MCLVCYMGDALDIVTSGPNLMLTGQAGIGKTTLLKHIISKLKGAGQRVCVVCPTGIASTQFVANGGTTLHRQGLLDRTRGYSTDMDGIPKVNILLVGNVGAGKSSVFNTIDSAFKERVATQAEAKTTGGSVSVTKMYKVYKPGGRREGEVAFAFCDTMGMELEEGLAVEDMVYIFDGNIPNGFLFNPHGRITPDDAGFIRTPSLSQRIHCVAIIIDGNAMASISQQEKQKFRRISEMAGARGVALVILVTHIDKICELVDKNVKMVHQSVAVKEVVEDISHVTGINISQIFPVKNYTKELETSYAVDVLILTALRKILDFADDYLDNVQT